MSNRNLQLYASENSVYPHLSWFLSKELYIDWIEVMLFTSANFPTLLSTKDARAKFGSCMLADAWRTLYGVEYSSMFLLEALSRENYMYEHWDTRFLEKLLPIRYTISKACKLHSSSWRLTRSLVSGRRTHQVWARILMAAPEVQGIDLFKIAGSSISGWIPSLIIICPMWWEHSVLSSKHLFKQLTTRIVMQP